MSYKTNIFSEVDRKFVLLRERFVRVVLSDLDLEQSTNDFSTMTFFII